MGCPRVGYSPNAFSPLCGGGALLVHIRRFPTTALYRNTQRFRGGIVSKAHPLVYHSTQTKNDRNIALGGASADSSSAGVSEYSQVKILGCWAQICHLWSAPAPSPSPPYLKVSPEWRDKTRLGQRKRFAHHLTENNFAIGLGGKLR